MSDSISYSVKMLTDMRDKDLFDEDYMSSSRLDMIISQLGEGKIHVKGSPKLSENIPPVHSGINICDLCNTIYWITPDSDAMTINDNPNIERACEPCFDKYVEQYHGSSFSVYKSDAHPDALNQQLSIFAMGVLRKVYADNSIPLEMLKQANMDVNEPYKIRILASPGLILLLMILMKVKILYKNTLIL